MVALVLGIRCVNPVVVTDGELDALLDGFSEVLRHNRKFEEGHFLPEEFGDHP